METKNMTSGRFIEQIARICHETNRAYCESIGDNTQLSWDKAEQWQRDSAVSGVEFKITHPNVTPEQQHQAWCDDKVKEGWVFGEVKDAIKKEHPCLVPYDQLPLFQQRKDALFTAIVTAMMGDKIISLSFGEAINAAKKGRKVARSGWNGKNMWVAYMSGMSLPAHSCQEPGAKVNDRTAKLIGEDTPLITLPYFAMWTADKKWLPGWLASQTDMLAEDWQVVE